MSLLGLDVGTSGCKAAVFSESGDVLAAAYQEYDIVRPQPGWAQLDAEEVWQKVCSTLRAVASVSQKDPVRAMAVSSLGEAVVPVSDDRRILAPSMLNADQRGESYLPELRELLDEQNLYRINGNTLGNHYSLTKLMWLRDQQPQIYAATAKLLHWSGFISYMLGAEPRVDYSLANRTLLFDLQDEDWSQDLLALTGVDRQKLPQTVPSGTIIGKMDAGIAAALGLNPGIVIVSGAHDQCANGIGCDVLHEGRVMYGMGTVFCAMPVFRQQREPALMLPRGLNTEHHAYPGLFASFIYNQGGALLKWYRDTFAVSEKAQAAAEGVDCYPRLLAEIPEDISSITVLPHFSPTGPPNFIADSSGMMVGLRLETARGDILKGIMEGVTFYLREVFETLPAIGIETSDFRVVGGGSKSDAWIQISADIFGKPFVRPAITEAGALGAAILSGSATGVFDSIEEGCQAMVRLDRCFEPEPEKVRQYNSRFHQYTELFPLLSDYLKCR